MAWRRVQEQCIRGRAFQPRFKTHDVMASWLGGLLAISALSLISSWSHYALVVAPFGASTVLLFGHPSSPLAQPQHRVRQHHGDGSQFGVCGNPGQYPLGDGAGGWAHHCPWTAAALTASACRCCGLAVRSAQSPARICGDADADGFPAVDVDGVAVQPSEAP